MTPASPRVLVVGGSSGIGAATARRFAAEGAEVLVSGRDERKLARVVEALGDRGAALPADARDSAAVRALMQQAGPLDHLVITVSGAAGGGPFATLPLADLREGFAAKFWPYVELLQAALPALAERASVTLVTAGSARAALPGTSGLAAINGALEAMVGPLAAELAPRRVNAVSPGVVRTPWWDALPTEQREAVFAGFAAALPVRRIGEAEEIAAAIVALATNGFVTGTVLDVAGGGQLASGAGLG